MGAKLLNPVADLCRYHQVILHDPSWSKDCLPKTIHDNSMDVTNLIQFDWHESVCGMNLQDALVSIFIERLVGLQEVCYEYTKGCFYHRDPRRLWVD